MVIIIIIIIIIPKVKPIQILCFFFGCKLFSNIILIKVMISNVTSNVTVQWAAFRFCMQQVMGKNRTPVTKYNAVSSLRFPSV